MDETYKAGYDDGMAVALDLLLSHAGDASTGDAYDALIRAMEALRKIQADN